MRLPTDISSTELINLLKKLGYQISRQKGSHIRLTTLEKGEHHITIPNHNPLRLGTLSQYFLKWQITLKKPKKK
jgi:predicted RNA binding protein YcfA (HicA-like mRNA interferase family)